MARWGRSGLWMVDHALPATGLVLVVLGVAAWTPAFSVGCGVLALAFLGWVAECDGLAVPRPGRAPIRTRGCWETPQAFTVRHRGAVLLFSRDEELGGWSDDYTVHESPLHAGADPKWELPLLPGAGWVGRGRTPVAGLRFEHHERASYVVRALLARALDRTRV